MVDIDRNAYGRAKIYHIAFRLISHINGQLFRFISDSLEHTFINILKVLTVNKQGRCFFVIIIVDNRGNTELTG